MDLGIKNKKVLITGASQGLGKTLAESFADEGCKVGIIARRENKLNEVLKGLKGDGHYCQVADLSQEDQVDKVVAALEKSMGGFDIVIHNLGGGLDLRDVFSSRAEWRKVWDFNVGIAIQINNLLVPKMQKNKWGRVVHVASISGRHLLGSAPYALAKSSVVDYAKILGREVAPDGVVVSTILPGAFAYEGSYWDNVSKDNPAKLKDFLTNHLRIGRLGTTQEIADFILFMSSAKASFAVGADIPVDGGTV